jgi:hypothetical protein
VFTFREVEKPRNFDTSSLISFLPFFPSFIHISFLWIDISSYSYRLCLWFHLIYLLFYLLPKWEPCLPFKNFSIPIIPFQG